MAEVLTLVAEEMGRVFGMVWSGIGVAVRLNNQVMTTVLKVTTRIVQLLLLLTHKVQLFTNCKRLHMYLHVLTLLTSLSN